MTGAGTTAAPLALNVAYGRTSQARSRPRRTPPTRPTARRKTCSRVSHSDSWRPDSPSARRRASSPSRSLVETVAPTVNPIVANTTAASAPSPSAPDDPEPDRVPGEGGAQLGPPDDLVDRVRPRPEGRRDRLGPGVVGRQPPLGRTGREAGGRERDEVERRAVDDEERAVRVEWREARHAADDPDRERLGRRAARRSCRRRPPRSARGGGRRRSPERSRRRSDRRRAGTSRRAGRTTRRALPNPRRPGRPRSDPGSPSAGDRPSCARSPRGSTSSRRPPGRARPASSRRRVSDCARLDPGQLDAAGQGPNRAAA